VAVDVPAVAADVPAVAADVPADKSEDEETAGGLADPAADHLLLLYELAP
jgi:hypothetical protein